MDDVIAQNDSTAKMPGMPTRRVDSGKMIQRRHVINSLGNSATEFQMPPKNTGARGGPRPKKDGQTADLYRIGGVDLPYDPELELDKPKPTPLFPAYKVPTPKPLTDKEKAQVAGYRAFREKIHNGPLYTILGDNARVTKPGESRPKQAASLNAFEGMPKYSQKYAKKKRMIPKLDTRPYMLDFFPTDLHSTLDPSLDETLPPSTTPKPKKTLTIPSVTNPQNDADTNADQLSGEEGMDKDPEDEDPLMGEDVDDEFEDEDEEGGDYNAEQYFDDGGEEEDYGGDGGGGGGGEDGAGWFD